MDQTPINPSLRDDPINGESMGRYRIVAEGDRVISVSISEQVSPAHFPGGGTRLAIRLENTQFESMTAQLTISQANDLRRAVAEFLIAHDADVKPAHDGGA